MQCLHFGVGSHNVLSDSKSPRQEIEVYNISNNKSMCMFCCSILRNCCVAKGGAEETVRYLATTVLMGNQIEVTLAVAVVASVMMYVLGVVTDDDK
ncbi:hypothetical protein Ancab_011154 [Ancistrocladus abbreviatus]